MRSAAENEVHKQMKEFVNASFPGMDDNNELAKLIEK